MSTKKTQGGHRMSLLKGVSLIAAATIAGVVPAPAQAQDTEEEEAIVVTGSRIRQANLEATSPITSLTADDITTQGVTRLEDMTNQLPQVFATQGSAVSNGSSGTAELSLRGLGSGRTLVLLNGIRMPYGSDATSAADLNTIPGAMVERVEVVTGGRSAVYGSDAISGVVNFIMRDDFEGLRVDAQYGFYNHENDSDQGNLRDTIGRRGLTNPAQFALPDDNVTDGYSKEVSLIFGASSPDGRGNVTAYLTYRNNDAILQGQRDYSACSLAAGLNAVNVNGAGQAAPGTPANTQFTCGGSSTAYPGRFFNSGFASRTIDSATGNTFRPFVAATDQYNFGPTNYFQRPDERYAFGAFARYEINDNIEAYASTMFSDYRTVAQIAPSGNFLSTSQLNCGNPLFGAGMATFFGCTAGQIAGDTVATPQMVTAYVGRRNVEGGGRQDSFRMESFRQTIGLRGPIADSWEYDITAMYARNASNRQYLNEMSVTRLGRALDVLDADPGVGVDPQCRSFLNGTDPNCVPYDIFALPNAPLLNGQPRGPSAAALAYLQVPLLRSGETSQQLVIATMTGELPITSPWAETPIALSFGAEYRRDYLSRITDVSFQTGDGAGQGGPTLGFPGAASDVFELFAEGRVVIAENQPFAEQMSVDAAYRTSTYSNNASSETYNVGLDWAPTQDIRFRASYAQAARAPNVIELFSAQGPGLFDMPDDPCDRTDPASDGFIPDNDPRCEGGAAYQVNDAEANGGALSSPAGQYNGLFGGNPNVSSEEGTTLTYGFVLQPRFIPGFSLSVDYFDIEVTNLISTVGAASTVAACYATVPDPAACALISRNTNNGTLWVGNGIVSDLNVNTASALTTSGYDFNANYSFGMGALGDANLALIATKLEDYNGGCEGLYGAGLCGTPNPEWRGRFRATWETPWDLDLTGTVRYYASVDYAGTTQVTAPDYSLDAQTYLDVAATYELGEATRFRAGVNNVLDREPPLSRFTGAGFGNGNTFPQVYDSNGRYIFMGVTVDF
jgi:outer membrane receptor protein involved in Fe transport